MYLHSVFGLAPMSRYNRYAMKIDLHTHSTASDGTLAPHQLLMRAVEQNVTAISVTDHDTIDAYAQLSNSSHHAVTVIPGIEFSTTWAGRNIHVLGLNVDLRCSDLLDGITLQQRARNDRAQRIAEKLSVIGVSDLYEKARSVANGATIGRPHFAHVLVDEGIVTCTKQAYKKHLGNGKRGDVRQFWADLASIICWIRAAGGTAVLAHPGHYNLTRTKLYKLGADFVAAGGQAIEVCNGLQTASITSRLADLCESLQLSASCGSDFHHAGLSWSELGRYTGLPAQCTPVWDTW